MSTEKFDQARYAASAYPTLPYEAHVHQQHEHDLEAHHGHHHDQLAEHDGKKGWSSGLFGCSFGGFCLSCWLPCAAYGQNKTRYAALANNQPLAEKDVEFCSGNAILYCLLQYVTGCACCLDVCVRSDVRKRNGIGGNGCADCCVSFWCPCCSQQQVARELKTESERLLESRAVVGQQMAGTQQMKI